MSVNWNFNNVLLQNRKIKHQSANIEFCWIFQSLQAILEQCNVNFGMYIIEYTSTC